MNTYFATSENTNETEPNCMPNDGAPSHKSGFVTFVGRPNAGKSTLLNAIMGKKIAITSNTAQTTRHRFRAVYTRPDFQLIIVDTPGLHKAHDALGEQLNSSALKALEDVDVTAMLVDASAPIGTGDEWVARQVAHARGPKLLVLSKSDLVSDQEIARQREAGAHLGSWDDILVCSATMKEGLDSLLSTIVRFLPEGPQWFDADMDTDQPLEVLIAEFIREKVLRNFRDEIPHAVGVQTDEVHYSARQDLYRIRAIIFTEHESQKGMIIGRKGAAIKRIGSEARADLERLLGCQVYLDLSVKVKKRWRRDEALIRRFGYGEGA